MTRHDASAPPPDRAALEKLLSADARAITAQSDRIGRQFARQNDVGNSDLHALLHIMVAETAGKPLSLAQLRQRMDVSPPAITYLVDRMMQAGHIRREHDPEDRRKWLLRYEDRGMALAHEFFSPLGDKFSAAFADMPDEDLLAAHRVFAAMMAAMSAFEDEIANGDPDLSGDVGREAPIARRRKETPRPTAAPVKPITPAG